MDILTVKNLWEAGERFGLQLNAGQNGLCKQILQVSIRHDPFQKTIKAGELLIARADRLFLAAKCSAAHLQTGMRQLCAQQTPCIISPDGIVPGAVVKAVSNRLSLPFLSSPYPADFLESRLLGFLREKIEKRIAVCGVFLTFRGKGILIRGDSGTGKSSSALELILRGGQLISDDIVELSRTAEDTVVGACPDAIRNLMDMKGRGIVNLKDTLGCRAIANESRVDLVISLTKDPTDEAKCRAVFRMLGVEIPMVCLSAGKRPSDIAMRIVETIMHRYPDTLQQQPYDDKLLPHSTYTLESVRVL